MQVNKRILITVDHKWRDLPATMVLKYFLERFFNCSVYICRQGSELQFCTVYLPHCVIFPHILDESKVVFSKILKQMNIDLIIYPTEGIPSLKRIYEFYSGKFVDMSQISVQLCWGKGSYQIYREYDTVPENKLKVIGSSRFDFYTSPLNKLTPTKQNIFNKYGLSSDLPTVLWTTNFVKASSYEINKDAYLNDIKNYKLTTCFPDPDDSAKQDITTRNMMLDYFKKFCLNQNVNLLIKHHPMESPIFYQNLRAEFKNTKCRVAIVQNNYIWDLIPYVDLVVQRSCTTGIEAFIAKKPVLEMQINPSDNYYINEELNGCSDLITSYESFELYMKKYIQHKDIMPEQINNQKKFLDKWCDLTDGKNTFRLASFISQYVNAKNSNPKLLLNKESVKQLFRHYLYSVLKLPYYLPLKSILSRKEPPDFIGRHDKWITQTDVEQWNQLIQSTFENYKYSDFN